VLRYYRATRVGRSALAAARSALAELAGELLSQQAPAAPHSRARSRAGHD